MLRFTAPKSLAKLVTIILGYRYFERPVIGVCVAIGELS